MFRNANNVYDLLKTAEFFLKSKGLHEPRCDAEIILSSILQIKRTKLFFFENYELIRKQISRYEEHILRRANREPTAYITGCVEFMGLKFKVNKDVLIPRFETEIVVENVIDIALKKNKRSALDLCTGSGCIAISLSKFGSLKNITASDISKKSLNVAKENAKNNDVVNVNFIESNIFNKINNKFFDVIVANPPYVSYEEYKNLEPELKYEPELALKAKNDGLFFYNEIATKAKKYLKNCGYVVVELNANKYSLIKQIFLQNCYKNIEIINDYARLPRVLKAQNG
ncbi:MAG: peptide chain release factor N(5)-glutamine methyltransferase [Endomicrobium sp.]|jgi:release factor glutamine methyltransferase|nr:peptide chain release factor N(5)-glutamine methyltransferase [Endomicrobium sp.]